MEELTTIMVGIKITHKFYNIIDTFFIEFIENDNHLEMIFNELDEKYYIGIEIITFEEEPYHQNNSMELSLSALSMIFADASFYLNRVGIDIDKYPPKLLFFRRLG